LACFNRYGDPRRLHSFPTRRSSDLLVRGAGYSSVAWASGPPPPRSIAGSIVDGRRGSVSPLGSYPMTWRASAWLRMGAPVALTRSEEHTSELQSRENLVCRLLLEKK